PTDDKSSGAAVESAKRIKKTSQIICKDLGYSSEKLKRVVKVNFASLEDDDLKVTAQLFDDCADRVVPEVGVSDKAHEFIEEYTDHGVVGKALRIDSDLVKKALYNLVADRAKAIALDAADGTSKRPKVTGAMAQQALTGFYVSIEVEKA
ncbi:MAG: hypothetical protein KAJ19_14555, partial [Gammaproteobacteria bacterium]|nr:hypothetical protein [Gammaproteobacteria bacterium]